ncbi:hypothetical protein CLAIMM_02082 [Cladophialophora immunda]|nr:hypothetical protein CLAIMM_02082 [Cladophialophora immunda]
MTVTSIAILHLKEGERPEDSNTTAGVLLQRRLSDILTAPGVQSCRWGRSIEHPDIMYLIVDWETLQNHIDFSNKPRDDATEISVLCYQPPRVHHAIFDPSPPRRSLSEPHSPVTEIVTICFPLHLCKQSQEKVSADTKEFRSILEGPNGCNGSAGGWILEEINPSGKEEKSKAFTMMFGWDSVEAHNDFMKKPHIQEHVHLIQGLPGLASLEMCHVTLTEVEP